MAQSLSVGQSANTAFTPTYNALKSRLATEILEWTSWVALLTEADTVARTGKAGSTNIEDVYRIDIVRDAYDTFLARFPYCYGYWKKYAEHEYKNGAEKSALMRVMQDQQREFQGLGGDTQGATDATSSADVIAAEGISTSRKVYERGVVAVSHSVELWMAFAAFMSESYTPAAARIFYASTGSMDASSVDDVTVAGWATHDIRRCVFIRKRMFASFAHSQCFVLQYFHAWDGR
jgi:hypothetical protein